MYRKMMVRHAPEVLKRLEGMAGPRTGEESGWSVWVYRDGRTAQQAYQLIKQSPLAGLTCGVTSIVIKNQRGWLK